ncbi:MAG TPA: hypothetical protein VFV10_06615, partial [Gammaproteobacteria bacterium]|nr:hypothetical protein [Gammaproteobacteria bacterium]
MRPVAAMRPVGAVLVALAGLACAVAYAGEPVYPDARSGPDPVLREILIKAVREDNGFVDRFDAEVW